MLNIFTFQDRKQSLQQVDEFLTKEIAPKELVGDIKVISSYIQNLSVLLAISENCMFAFDKIYTS